MLGRRRDPFRPIIGALNEYLHAYHMYRTEALSGHQKPPGPGYAAAVFPYSVTLAGGRQRSGWCTEKAHSITHWGDNNHIVGSIRTATTQVTETRMKSAVKT